MIRSKFLYELYPLILFIALAALFAASVRDTLSKEISIIGKTEVSKEAYKNG